MYPQVFGKYVLERELARGGMARVLLATLRGAGGFEKKLVVKQIRDELALDTDFVHRFVEEAKTTVALSHPNIVPVYELGVEQGTYFLAMELVEGASLAEILDAGPAGKLPLSPEQGAYVGIEICRALDYAHRRMQVVHRDITPRNVMVDEEGQIKLIDFGIAARAEIRGAPGERVFGSPGHMPPEQLEGRELGPATDLFAVAVLLMELWSGRAPFRRKTPEDCAAAMQGTHPKPSDVNARLLPLDDIIAAAMSLEADKRPQSADDLGRALRKFVADVDLGDVARSLGERSREARATVERRADAETLPALPKREPSHLDFVTKTFAARDDVEPQVPSSTRRMGSERPPPSERIETIATRPLATPLHAFPPPGAPAERKSAATWPLALGVVAIAVAVFGVRALRGEGKDATPSPNVPTTKTSEPATSAAPSASGALAEPATSAVSVTPPASAIVPTKVSAPVASSSAAAGSASATSDAVEARTPGRVSVFCDPGTKVSIDGATRGGCPLRDLALDPGAHEVRFVFEPTGESRGERVFVAAGKRVTLRADFTSSTPVVRVEQ